MPHSENRAAAGISESVRQSPPRPADAQSLAGKLAPLFDGAWYLSRYPDVAAAGMDPMRHYINHGAVELRNPHPLFDARWYLSQNPDVAETGIGPLEHYIEHGAAERRDPHPQFDTGWYLSLHPEAAAAGTTPLQHYMDHHHGRDPHFLTRNIAGKIGVLRTDASLWPPAVSPTAEAGMVISACGRLFKHLYANLRNIREQGCDLPVDVWHLPGEFTDKQIAFLSPMANFVDAGRTPFNGLSGRHEVHGFKAWMLSQSRFRKTLMLDVNCFALQNPEAVFRSGHGCILWRDGPWGVHLEAIIKLKRSLDIREYFFEFESGQLYADKAKAGVENALRLAAALNTLGRRLYAYTHGDKETYAIAFQLLGEEFSIAPEPVVHCMDPARFDSAGLLQPWFDGSALFYHPLGDKEVWWRYKNEWAALEREAAEAEKQCQ